MKTQKNQYFACSDRGYIKYQNVPIKGEKLGSEITVASRCNQLLPYRVHKIQTKQNVAQAQKTQKLNLKQISQLIEGEDNLQNNYSSLQMIPGSHRFIQKDEVHSITMDDKSSARTRAFSKCNDLTQSAITQVKSAKRQMKRSLNSFQTPLKNSENDIRLSHIYSQLTQQKNDRKCLQEKYNILLNLVHTGKHIKTAQSDIQEEKIPEKLQKTCHKLESPKKRFKSKINTSESDQTQADYPIIIRYAKSKHKKSRGKTTVIQLQQQQTQQCHHCNGKKSYNSFSTIPSTQQNQLKQQLKQLKQKMNIMEENIEYLEQKLIDQQRKFEKELLERDIRQRQKQIEKIEKENQRLRVTNEILQKNKENKMNKKDNQNGFGNFFDGKNTLLASFIMSFFMILLVLNLQRSRQC